MISISQVIRYDGPANQNDNARTLVVNSDGNVFVAGESAGLDGSYDFATVKYDHFLQNQL